MVIYCGDICIAYTLCVSVNLFWTLFYSFHFYRFFFDGNQAVQFSRLLIFWYFFTWTTKKRIVNLSVVCRRSRCSITQLRSSSFFLVYFFCPKGVSVTALFCYACLAHLIFSPFLHLPLWQFLFFFFAAIDTTLSPVLWMAFLYYYWPKSEGKKNRFLSNDMRFLRSIPI